MAKSRMVLWSRSLLTIVLIATANRPAAGSLVTVKFQGSGSGTTTFVGSFNYEQSLRSTNGTFNFAGTGLGHGVAYKIGAGTLQSAPNSQSDPFTITTTSGAFTLLAIDPRTPTLTHFSIVMPCSGLSPTDLPGCSIFPITAPANTKFTLTVNGVITYSGTISSFTSCTGPAFAEPAPTSQAPENVHIFTYPAPAPAPAPCPVYACPPRQACFLTRLFPRRSHRGCCW